MRKKRFAVLILAALFGLGWSASASEAARIQWVEISEEDTFPNELLNASMYATEDALYVAYRDDGDITVQRFDGTEWDVLEKRQLLDANGHDPVLVVDQGVPYLAVIDQCPFGCFYGVSVLKYDESADQWQFLGNRGFTGDDVLRFDFAVVNGKPRVIALFAEDAIIKIWEWDGGVWTVLEETDLSQWWSPIELDVDLDRANGSAYLSVTDAVYSTLEVAFFDGTDWSGLRNLTVNTAGPDEWDIAVRDGVAYFAYGEYDFGAGGFRIHVQKHEDYAEGWKLVGSTPLYGIASDPRLEVLGGRLYLTFPDFSDLSNPDPNFVAMRYKGGQGWAELGNPAGDRRLFALYDLEMFDGSLVIISQMDDGNGPNMVYKVIPIYTVQFDSMGGSPVNSVEAADGSRIGEPAKPQRDGFVFDGWYKDSNYNAKWNFDIDTVTADMTLYAKWTTPAPTPPASTAPAGGAVREENGIPIFVNNREVHIGFTATEEVNGRQVTIVEVDKVRLRQLLEEEGEHAVVIIPVPAESPVVAAVLNGQVVKQMEILSASIEIIARGRAVYVLPAAQIRIDDFAGKLEGNPPLEEIQVRIEISEPDPETARIVEDSISGQGLVLVVPPMQFRIVAVYGNLTVEAAEFSAYVERAIAIPDGVDPGQITTAVVVEEDGRIRHVPTKIINMNGRHYAQINSLTNSVYSLIRHEAGFEDVENHWAKEAILDMGARLIVNGTGDRRFEPDRGITRAEFAAVLARALGLKPVEGEGNFTDVEASAWYGSPVYTAYAWQLIRGFDDGTFRPHDRITREQAMVMIAQAMKIAGLPGAGGGQSAEEVLASFADAGDVSGWAAEGTADAVAAGIITGRSADMLAPKEHITRAETAMMIRRLLRNSNLID
jgi:uncharacterized repeat protein (TIGR02543 family)